MDIKTLKTKILVLDGAMGTMLQQNGLMPGDIPEAMNMLNPGAVKSIHEEYFAAGAEMVLTNTFGANRNKLKKAGYDTKSIVTRAVELAMEASSNYGGFAALDIGPIGEMLKPMGTVDFNEAYELFKEQIVAGAAAGAKAIVIETMTDLLETKCALLAAKENSDLPVFCTMSFDKGGRTFMGVSIPSMALTLEGLGADAVGFNCSVGPSEMLDMTRELVKWTNLPLIVKPNAGLPSIIDGKPVYTVNEEEFSSQMGKLLDLGVTVIGGCCGTTPEFIKKLSELAKGRVPAAREEVSPCAVCSYGKAVSVDRVRIIGERINPTGNKAMRAALLTNDSDYIVRSAAEQIEAGADILDVNVGLPEIDEKDAMVRAIKNIQGVAGAPLQIDSSNPEVIEAALRIYNGKPVVNSVNGKDSVLGEILPIVKKYGAAVVGLTLDENGIPKSAQERCLIAEKIVSVAISYGIPHQNVFIDCLTVTAGAEQETAYEAIKAVALVKNRLAVKTVLGISNISFGLPAREKLNRTFLALALSNGLDMPIINPNSKDMTDTIICFNQLCNVDLGSVLYLKRFGGTDTEAVYKPTLQSDREDISYCVINGLKGEVVSAAKVLLENNDGLSIISGHITPSLDYVGKEYESGRIYLPQLLRSAEAAKAALEVIKKSLPGSVSKTGNKIILATVKGDIHDIGKNIVKTILENYGFSIIDLGLDVPSSVIVEATKNSGAKLIGLSALMTTTVKSMEETIKDIRNTGMDIRIIVGGAVLTEEVSAKIGADFYAKDAMSAVEIAKTVYAEHSSRI